MIDHLTFFFITALSLVAMAAAHGLGSRFLRWIMIVLIVVLALWSLWLFQDHLSRAKNVDIEFRLSGHEAMTDVEVLYFRTVPGEALYVLYALEKPRLFYYPWSDKTRKLAKQLQEEGEKAKAQGVPLVMKNPFAHSWETERVPHPNLVVPPELPQKPPVPKPKVPQYDI